MENSIDTYQFCEEILSQYEHGLSNEVDDFFQLLGDFSTKYDSLAKKLPYHINVIDELHVNENANSRILAALLQYNEGGDYTMLMSFVDFFMKDQNIEISQPIITSENLRIDLLVREPRKYAIIFENKIYGAVLQKNQIARYIQKMRNEGEGFKDEQIHVVLLPPTDDYQTNECSWKEPCKVCETCDCNNCNNENKSLREDFRDRFTVVTFREGIIEWLKEAVIPNCRQKEMYLYTAAIQYLDYLEGYFDLRTINNTMNMELQQLIIEKLQLNGKTNDQQLEVIKEKSDEINHLLSQMQLIKEAICQNMFEKTMDMELHHLIKDRLHLNDKNKTKEQKLEIIEKKLEEINRLSNQFQSLKESIRQNIFEEWKEKVKTQYPELHPLEKGRIIDVTLGYINEKKVTVSIYDYYKTLCCEVEIDDSLPTEERRIVGTKIMSIADFFQHDNEHFLWSRFDLYDCVGAFSFFEKVVEKCKKLVD